MGHPVPVLCKLSGSLTETSWKKFLPSPCTLVVALLCWLSTATGLPGLLPKPFHLEPLHSPC